MSLRVLTEPFCLFCQSPLARSTQGFWLTGGEAVYPSGKRTGIPPWEKDNYLQECLKKRGYVSFLGGVFLAKNFQKHLTNVDFNLMVLESENV